MTRRSVTLGPSGTITTVMILMLLPVVVVLTILPSNGSDTAPSPSVTVTATVTAPPITLPPAPPKTVVKTVVVRAERASRSSTNRGTSSTVAKNVTLACIRYHESRNNYRAVSRTGKYRGAYQFDRNYAPIWATRAGYGQWSTVLPDRWPPSVQDAVAYDMGKTNRYAAWRKWVSYSCPWS